MNGTESLARLNFGSHARNWSFRNHIDLDDVPNKKIKASITGRQTRCLLFIMPTHGQYLVTAAR